MDLHIGPDGLGCNADLSGQSVVGQPFINSHYARQLQGWAALMALTGQQYDAPASSLHLRPACNGVRPVAGGVGGAVELVLPVLTPVALALLRVVWPGPGTVATSQLEVLSGALPVTLRVTTDLGRCPPELRPIIAETRVVRLI